MAQNEFCESHEGVFFPELLVVNPPGPRRALVRARACHSDCLGSSLYRQSFLQRFFAIFDVKP